MAHQKPKPLENGTIMKKQNLVLIALCFLMVFSCNPKKNLNYVQNIENTAIQMAKQHNTIQVADQLAIVITAKDMDVVKPFNQNYHSSGLMQYSQPSSNIMAAPQTVSAPTYVVDSDYQIEFPILGKINVKNKSTEELSKELKQKLGTYVKEPVVSVRAMNFKVSVLGEVNRPGTYQVMDEQINLFGALGLAGDLTVFGERDNVVVIRNVNGELTKTKLDLTDAQLLNSTFYQLKQNDIIIVGANKTKQRSSIFGSDTSVYISVAGLATSLLFFVLNFTKK
jgi:polysaccharide biosynthesis/export protein